MTHRLLILGSFVLASACANVSPLAPSPESTVTPARLAQVIYDGNSLVQSRAPTAPPYPDLIALPSDVRSANISLGGSTTPIQDASFAVSPIAGVNVVVLWEGSNDLWIPPGGVEHAERDLEVYSQHRRADGWIVVLLTILPRSNLGTPVSFETDRQAVNSWLRATWTEYADALVDVASDPDMGPPGSELNPAFYLADRVHLAEGGARRIASLVATALRRFDARVTVR